MRKLLYFSIFIRRYCGY